MLHVIATVCVPASCRRKQSCSIQYLSREHCGDGFQRWNKLTKRKAKVMKEIKLDSGLMGAYFKRWLGAERWVSELLSSQHIGEETS
jgi:hypothetical protein